MQGDGTPIPKYRNEINHMGPTARAWGRSAAPPRVPINPARLPRGTRPGRAAVKYVGCHPKASELCPRRGKPGETLVDARHGSDVQIDRQTRV